MSEEEVIESVAAVHVSVMMLSDTVAAETAPPNVGA
jgi:hypothetical protein